MSIAFHHGGRQRPVDVSVDDGDEIVLDGTRLKQERIRRGLSVIEAARLVTLSREQVEQIESGGLGAFYGARHKLLAVRKYANGLGLPFEQLLPAPERETNTETAAALPPAVEAGDSAAAGKAGDDAATAVGIFIEPDMQPLPVADGERSPSPHQAAGTPRRWPLALVVAISLVLVFGILREMTQEPAPAASLPVEAVAEPVTAATAGSQAGEAAALPKVPVALGIVATAPVPSALPANAEAPAVAQVLPSTAASAQPAATNDACALPAGPDTPRWAPAQARNASTRVFISSAAPVEACVTDATGTSTPLKLKPGTMSSASGKPPYVIRSERLPQLQIFLQGLKVRVPASATAVHLLTTQSVRSPEPPAGTAD